MGNLERETKKETFSKTGGNWETQRKREILTQRERQWQKFWLMGRNRVQVSPSDGQRERGRLIEGKSKG